MLFVVENAGPELKFDGSDQGEFVTIRTVSAGNGPGITRLLRGWKAGTGKSDSRVGKKYQSKTDPAERYLLAGRASANFSMSPDRAARTDSSV
jgi:hypothetical protein